MKNTININTIKRAGYTLSAKKAIKAKRKECPHSYYDDNGLCVKCGYNTFRLTNRELLVLRRNPLLQGKINKGIVYNPHIHKQLTCDKVISIVPKGGLWKELVGVYWKGTDGASVLFETTPSKAHKIVEIFNAVNNKQKIERCTDCGHEPSNPEVKCSFCGGEVK